MPRLIYLLPTLAALLGSQATPAQDLAGDVKTCREVTDPVRRLACYDAMPLAAAPAKAAPAVAVAPVTVDPVAKFGQESVKAPAGAPPELKQIESRIPGKFTGWGPNSRIELENGQVWRIADGSEAFYELQNPKATVHRGVLGAFFLQIDGVGFQVRVTRVR